MRGGLEKVLADGSRCAKAEAARDTGVFAHSHHGEGEEMARAILRMPPLAAAFRLLPPPSAGFFACVFFWRCSLGIGADGHGLTWTHSREARGYDAKL